MTNGMPYLLYDNITGVRSMGLFVYACIHIANLLHLHVAQNPFKAYNPLPYTKFK